MLKKNLFSKTINFQEKNSSRLKSLITINSCSKMFLRSLIIQKKSSVYKKNDKYKQNRTLLKKNRENQVSKPLSQLARR